MGSSLCALAPFPISRLNATAFVVAATLSSVAPNSGHRLGPLRRDVIPFLFVPGPHQRRRVVGLED
jgi:hypothetical protein